MVCADTTGTTVPSGTFTKIIMDTALYDTEGCVDFANSQIVVPTGAQFVRLQGHLTYPPQNVGSGSGSVHLWRNGSSTVEAHYHNRQHYTATAVASEYCSMVAVTPWIPVMYANEAWTLVAFQASGGSVNSGIFNHPGAVENWLSAEFTF